MIMMSDCNDNDDNISQTSEKNETDWAMFGYEGQSNVLKLVCTGVIRKVNFGVWLVDITALTLCRRWRVG